MTRRTLLRLALMGVSSILAGPVRPSRASAATYPPGELALYNTHTAERLAVTYRDRAGRYDPQALGALDRLLRCHATGKVIAMDVRVIEFLNLVEKRLGGGLEIHVISGFRAPEYNARLVRAGRGVAERSLHTVGRAIDVRLPAVDLRAVWRTAVRLERGGVGYYPRSGFVHLDSGRFRRW